MIQKNEKKPRIEMSDIFAAALVYLGFILFLVALHLLTINSLGDIRAVLNTTFIVFLGIFMVSLVLGGVGVVIHIMRWMAWHVNTPEWKKNGGGNG